MESKETVLVTGGSGFVGLHIVLQLLQKGYHVRTTLRSLKNKDKIVAAMQANGIKDLSRLSFFEAELTKDDNWAEAMQGCDYVLSVASPVFFDVPKEENEAIRPAVEGVLRVLKFARDGGVKRVVMTSNFGAVGFSQADQTRETTEADWTDPDEKGLSIYEKSKLLAERAAWDFIATAGGALEFATINPVAIFGPSLDGHISGSLAIITNMLDGTWKQVPPITLNLVDVRDVAALHILAMEKAEAKGQRFIATADGQITMPGIAALIKKNRPEIAGKVSTRTLPVWLLKLAALFNKRAREGALFLRMNRNVSNAKAKQVLGWQPMASNETIVLDSVDSMVKFNPGNSKFVDMRTIADDTRTNILSEQFIPDNVFIYVAAGAIRVFDGNSSFVYVAGDAVLARKNRLAKYELLDSSESFQPILFCFDEPFLQDFQKKHQSKPIDLKTKETFIEIQKSELIESFIRSIKPYYRGVMQLDEAFEDIKYEELLMILLKTQPELAAILFDFRKPGKIDLEEFMSSHYQFNVSIERFAYLTGRSLSAFKRDFADLFNETPSRWLIKKRLEEAHFLISRKHQKPSDIYLGLGFEDLSHFSFAFRKRYGQTPSQLADQHL